MSSRGDRELRQRASDDLRPVEAGEAHTASPLDQLRLAGDLEEAEGSVDDLPPPLTPAPGAESPSFRLGVLRSDDR